MLDTAEGGTPSGHRPPTPRPGSTGRDDTVVLAHREVAPDRGRAGRPGRLRTARTRRWSARRTVSPTSRPRCAGSPSTYAHHGHAALAAPRARPRRPELPPGARHPRHRPLPDRRRPGGRGASPPTCARPGFESVPRPDIMAWKYRKLVTNAVGDVSAVLPDEAGRAEAAGPRRGRGGARGGRRAARHARGRPGAPRRPAPATGPDVDGPELAGPEPGPRTSGTEVDFRAGEIVLLGRLHGVPTPANERVQREVRQRIRDHVGVAARDRSAPRGRRTSARRTAACRPHRAPR